MTVRDFITTILDKCQDIDALVNIMGNKDLDDYELLEIREDPQIGTLNIVIDDRDALYR